MDATTKTNTKVKTDTDATEDVYVDISKGAVASLCAIGVVISVWSIASLIGGIVAAGGAGVLSVALVGAIFGL